MNSLNPLQMQYNSPFLQQSVGFSQILNRVKPYKLASDASFCDQLAYAVYRIWNGVKAIFGQSDWRVTERKLVDKANALVPLLGFVMPQNVLKTIKPQLHTSINAIVKLFLYLYIDSRIDAPENQTPEALQRQIDIMVDILVNKTSIAQKWSLEEQTIRDSFSQNPQAREVAFQKIMADRQLHEVIDSMEQMSAAYYTALNDSRLLDNDTIEALKTAADALKALIQTFRQQADAALIQNLFQRSISFPQMTTYMTYL